MPQSSEMNFSWALLNTRMQVAVARAKGEKLKAVSEALIDALPDMIGGLKALIAAPDASANQRLRSAEILFTAWARVLRTENRVAKTEVSKLKVRTKAQIAAAEKKVAEANIKRADLATAAERKKIQRTLNQAQQAIDKQKKETL